MPFASRAAAIMCVCVPWLMAQPLPKFMGRQVTIDAPILSPPDFSPESPATVCLEAPPQRQCYTASKDFGKNPRVTVVQLRKDLSALYFSAESGGVTGFGVHFALLRPGTGKDLENLFPESETTVSDQSQHAFWNDPSISEAPIFLTADYVWGAGESHFDPHRYTISAYILKRTFPRDPGSYYLEDRYITVGKYDHEKDEILAAERPEIVARLKRVKAAESTK